MAINPLRGDASLSAGDRGEFKLCFDVNALCFAEERLGKTTDEIVGQVSEEFKGWAGQSDLTAVPRVNAVLIRALLWAGLQRHHAGTHMAEAGEIMSDAGIAATVAAVLNAFFAAFGAEEGKKPARPRKAPVTVAGTG